MKIHANSEIHRNQWIQLNEGITKWNQTKVSAWHQINPLNSEPPDLSRSKLHRFVHRLLHSERREAEKIGQAQAIYRDLLQLTKEADLCLSSIEDDLMLVNTPPAGTSMEQEALLESARHTHLNALHILQQIIPTLAKRFQTFTKHTGTKTIAKLEELEHSVVWEALAQSLLLLSQRSSALFALALGLTEDPIDFEPLEDGNYVKTTCCKQFFNKENLRDWVIVRSNGCVNGCENARMEELFR